MLTVTRRAVDFAGLGLGLFKLSAYVTFRGYGPCDQRPLIGMIARIAGRSQRVIATLP